jgi:hypothetical protein
MDVEFVTAAATFWSIPISTPAGGKGDGIEHAFTYCFVMGGYQVFEIEIVEKILVLVCVISNA